MSSNTLFEEFFINSSKMLLLCFLMVSITKCKFDFSANFNRVNPYDRIPNRWRWSIAVGPRGPFFSYSLIEQLILCAGLFKHRKQSILFRPAVQSHSPLIRLNFLSYANVESNKQGRRITSKVEETPLEMESFKKLYTYHLEVFESRLYLSQQHPPLYPHFLSI